MMKTYVALGALAVSICAAGGANALQDDANAARPDTICSEDEILPAFVEHNVDELFTGGELLETYNYIEYHFENDAHYMRARAYLDEIGLVVFFGPYQSFENPDPVSDDALKGSVVSYLKRRFSRIEEYSGDDGRALVWEAGEGDEHDLSSCEAFSEDQP